MNEYKMEMTITCATGDADHFYNTVLMIAKGFEIDVIESKLGPIQKEVIIPPLPPQPPKQEKKNFLSITETSEYLSLSKHTLYKYTIENTIPHYKMGSRTLFKIDELEKWIEKRKVKPMV